MKPGWGQSVAFLSCSLLFPLPTRFTCSFVVQNICSKFIPDKIKSQSPFKHRFSGSVCSYQYVGSDTPVDLKSDFSCLSYLLIMATGLPFQRQSCSFFFFFELSFKQNETTSTENVCFPIVWHFILMKSLRSSEIKLNELFHSNSTNAPDVFIPLWTYLGYVTTLKT